MKIRDLTIMTLLSISVSSAQAGLIDFSNYGPWADAPAHFGDTFLGSDYIAELFWAPGITQNFNDLQYVPSADTLFFGFTGGDPVIDGAGYFSTGPTVNLPATGVVTIAIDVDRIGWGDSFNQRGVYDGGAWYPGFPVIGYFNVGGSALFQVTLPPDGPNWANMPAGLQWSVVPEPSSLALVVMSLVPLMLRKYLNSSR
jgi:hypothetical protein